MGCVRLALLTFSRIHCSGIELDIHDHGMYSFGYYHLFQVLRRHASPRKQQNTPEKPIEDPQPVPYFICNTLKEVPLILGVFQTITSTVTSVTTVAPAQSGNAYCENGQAVNGLSAPCPTGPCTRSALPYHITY